MSGVISDVRMFMQAADQENTVEQAGKQLGFALEEAGEALVSLGAYDKAEVLEYMSLDFKAGRFTQLVEAADKAELLDAALDTAWVMIGLAIALDADVEGAWAEIARSNMSKLDPATGKMLRDANGKVKKPPTYSPPNLLPFLRGELL